MSYVLPLHKSKDCALCGAENSTCKAEGGMDPSQGVVFIGMDPKYSVGAQNEIVGPAFDEGTVTHRFAKKPEAETVKAPPTVRVRRTRATKKKKEESDGHVGTAEQGRRRGGRGRQRRQVDGPGSVG